MIQNVIQTLSCCLLAFGTLFWMKNSLRTGGKDWSVWLAQLWGVFCMTVVSSSLHQAPDSGSAPVPVTCIERARVNTRARFSSSLSADTNVLGSPRNRDSCGCTSALPRPVISRRAVLSTLPNKRTRHVCKNGYDVLTDLI